MVMEVAIGRQQIFNPHNMESAYSGESEDHKAI